MRHVVYPAIQRRPGSTFVIPQVTDGDEHTERELNAAGLDATVVRHDYVLSAAQPFTLDDVAAILTDISGRPLTYEDTPMADYVARLVTAGFPPPAAEFLGAWFGANAAGEFTPGADLEHLLGRPPTTLRAFLTAQRA